MPTEHIEISGQDTRNRIYEITHDGNDYSIVREFIAIIMSREVSFTDYPIVLTMTISRNS